MVFAIFVYLGVVVFLIWAVAQMARQRRIRRDHPRDLVLSSRAGLAPGAMFLGFQEIVQPQVRHVIAEEQKEDRDDDANGEDEPPGGRLFHQQLRKIRNGEEVEEPTVKVSAELREGPLWPCLPAGTPQQPAADDQQ